MNQFRAFLDNTVGRCLYEFWLDCESYRDDDDDVNDLSSRRRRTRLFRSVMLR